MLSLARLMMATPKQSSQSYKTKLHGTDNAWKVYGVDTLENFVSSMEQQEIIKSPLVGKAMRSVDRANYVAKNERPYDDEPKPLGYGVTISAPHMHAWCLELFQAEIKPGMAVLDVGSGSGYLTACFASILVDSFPNDSGLVIGIDILPELVEYSISCTKKGNPNLMAPSGPVLFEVANGWEGAPSHAPFDFIHVGAAARSMPQTLVDQLKPGGKMVIPVHETPNSKNQALFLVEKPLDGSSPPLVERLMGVRYVPLVNQL